MTYLFKKQVLVCRGKVFISSHINLFSPNAPFESTKHYFLHSSSFRNESSPSCKMLDLLTQSAYP